jgi:Uncharacterised protein family UPF0547
MPGPTKKCPDCAETVLADAKVCRHCGYRFSALQRLVERDRKKRPTSCCGCSCGSAVLVALLAFVAISLWSGLGMLAALPVSLVVAVACTHLAHRLVQYPIVIRTLRLPDPASSE